MKTNLLTAAFIAVTLLIAATSSAQTFFLMETFPNEETGGSNDYDDDGSLASQDFGSWARTTSSESRVRVTNTSFASSPYSLIFQTTGSGTESAVLSSANLNLSSVSTGLCATNGLVLKFRVRRSTATTGHTLQMQFSNNGGGAYNNFGPANVLSVLANQDQWYTVSITIPNLPTNYWVNNFRIRFNLNRTTNDDATIMVDDMVITDPAVPDFSGAYYFAPWLSANNVNDFGVGDVYRFPAVVIDPVKGEILADIKIEKIVNASIDLFDNNDAGVPNRFQPRIAPDVPLTTTSRSGYVEFIVTFKDPVNATDTNIVFLDGVKYRHYDIDGSQGSGGGSGNNAYSYTFRETGWFTGTPLPALTTPAPTDLTSTTVVDGPTWRKILGETDEHTGLSNDPDVYFTATYLTVSVIRIRLGYDFVKTGAVNGNANIGQPAREYGTEFGCFDLTEEIPTPVKLINFSGSYKSGTTNLMWEVENEESFSRYELERSGDGNQFSAIGVRQPQSNGMQRKQYSYADDLTMQSGSVFFYRLKMVDHDGNFKYSNIIMVRKDVKNISGIMLSPNPVVSSSATARFTSATSGSVELHIMDMSGKVVLSQQAKVFQGENSISINNLERLQKGIYMLQMTNGSERSNVKFTVIH